MSANATNLHPPFHLFALIITITINIHSPTHPHNHKYYLPATHASNYCIPPTHLALNDHQRLCFSCTMLSNPLRCG